MLIAVLFRIEPNELYPVINMEQHLRVSEERIK